MESTAIEAYEIFKSHFSEKEAKTIMAWKDESLSKWVASKEDLNAVKSELKEDIAAVREDMVKMETRIIKWFVGCLMAQTGIAFAVMKLTLSDRAV
jgi:hypothetical protein